MGMTLVRAFCLLTACALLASAGCGGAKTAEVYGTVSLPDGKPLPGGSIVFYPTEGSKVLPCSTDIGEDGGCPYRFKPGSYVRYYSHTAVAILRAAYSTSRPADD